MQAQAYEGYFENGRFHTAGRTVAIPERKRVYITVLDEPVTDNENLEAWSNFFEGIEKIDTEPIAEFERVKFREVNI